MLRLPEPMTRRRMLRHNAIEAWQTMQKTGQICIQSVGGILEAVSIHSESTCVTRVFEVRPVLEGSGRDADPCQRQLLGPSVITKMIGP